MNGTLYYKGTSDSKASGGKSQEIKFTYDPSKELLPWQLHDKIKTLMDFYHLGWVTLRFEESNQVTIDIMCGEVANKPSHTSPPPTIKHVAEEITKILKAAQITPSLIKPVSHNESEYADELTAFSEKQNADTLEIDKLKNKILEGISLYIKKPTGSLTVTDAGKNRARSYKKKLIEKNLKSDFALLTIAALLSDKNDGGTLKEVVKNQLESGKKTYPTTPEELFFFIFREGLAHGRVHTPQNITSITNQIALAANDANKVVVSLDDCYTASKEEIGYNCSMM